MEEFFHEIKKIIKGCKISLDKPKQLPYTPSVEKHYLSAPGKAWRIQLVENPI
jgi:hypothetical protein